MTGISRQGYVRAFSGDALRLSKVYENKHTVIDSFFKSKEDIKNRYDSYTKEIHEFLNKVGQKLGEIAALHEGGDPVVIQLDNPNKSFEIKRENNRLRLVMIEKGVLWGNKRTLLRQDPIEHDQITNTNLYKTLVTESQNVHSHGKISLTSHSLTKSLALFNALDIVGWPLPQSCGHFFFLGSGFTTTDIAKRSEIVLQQADQQLSDQGIHSKIIVGPSAKLGRRSDDLVVDGAMEILDYIRSNANNANNANKQVINLKIATHSRGGNIGIAAYNLAMQLLEDRMEENVEPKELNDKLRTKLKLCNLDSFVNDRYDTLPPINVYFCEFDKVGGPNFINAMFTTSNKYAKYLTPPPGGCIYYQQLVSSLEDRNSHNTSSLITLDTDKTFIRTIPIDANHLHIVKSENKYRGANNESHTLFEQFIGMNLVKSSKRKGKDFVRKSEAGDIAQQTTLPPKRYAAIQLSDAKPLQVSGSSGHKTPNPADQDDDEQEITRRYSDGDIGLQSPDVIISTRT